MKALLGAAFHLIPTRPLWYTPALVRSFQETLHANSFPASFSPRVGANDHLCSRGNRPSSNSVFHMGATHSRTEPAATRSTRHGL